MASIISIEAALTQIISDENLTRIDVGMGGRGDKVPKVTIWYEVPDIRPDDVHGCSFGNGPSIDAAIADALKCQRDQLARCANYEPEQVAA